MPGLYAPFKVYTPGEVLTAADLNATDQNHITNQTPQMTDDYQLDLSQKREQTDPALGLATSLAGDLAQLRYALAKVGKVPFWDQIMGPPTTGLKGYYSGFKCSNGGGDPDHDITVGAGAARSDDNTTDIVLVSDITKQLDAAWAVGGLNGMLDGGAMVASTWYYIFVIMRLDTEQVDVLASTSFSAPTLPLNYTKKRLIFAVKTDVDIKIRGFNHIRDWVIWKTPILDQDITATFDPPLDQAQVKYLVSAPLGFQNEVVMNIWMNIGGQSMVYFAPPGTDDLAPSLTEAPLATIKASTAAQSITQIVMWTDTDGKVAVRSSTVNSLMRILVVAYRNIVAVQGG